MVLSNVPGVPRTVTLSNSGPISKPKTTRFNIHGLFQTTHSDRRVLLESERVKSANKLLKQRVETVKNGIQRLYIFKAYRSRRLELVRKALMETIDDEFDFQVAKTIHADLCKSEIIELEAKHREQAQIFRDAIAEAAEPHSLTEILELQHRLCVLGENLETLYKQAVKHKSVISIHEHAVEEEALTSHVVEFQKRIIKTLKKERADAEKGGREDELPRVRKVRIRPYRIADDFTKKRTGISNSCHDYGAELEIMKRLSDFKKSFTLCTSVRELVVKVRTDKAVRPNPAITLYENFFWWIEQLL